MINPADIVIIEFVDREYPDELNAGLWDTGALVDGEIKIGDAYCDFAIKRPSLTDGMFMNVLDRVGELEKS